MKAVIITFSDFNTNYGSMLQAFSMKNFLEKQGLEVEFIRYREFHTSCGNSSFKEQLVSKIKKSLLDIYALYRRKDKELTQKNFENFKKEYFSFS